ncbi:transposase [Caenispirillum bisanense]|uniref:transposase n=1 Tax=Caenispirillum bisanense TaxID=414052 RepID=UPI0031D2A27F
MVVGQRTDSGENSAGVELLCDAVDVHPDWPVRATSGRRWHDLPHLGRPTWLRLRRFRRDGPGGSRSHTRPPLLIGPPLLMTTRLAEAAILRCLTTPLARVAGELGVPPRKLRLLLARFLTDFAAAYRPAAADALGLDGVHIGGATWTVIADIEGNCLIDLLDDHNANSLAAALANLQRRDLVRLVAIDASTLERAAVRTVFPDPPLEAGQRVILALDRRHATALVLKPLALLRKSLGFTQQRQRVATSGRRRVDTLKALLERPNRALDDDQRSWLAAQFSARPGGERLRAAYEAKEAFLALWDVPDRLRAAQTFSTWRRDLAAAGLADLYATAVTTLGRDWRDEFLAAVARPGAGTGYVEALNRELKRLYGDTRGNASFPLLRARMLFAHGRPDTQALIVRLASRVAAELADDGSRP